MVELKTALEIPPERTLVCEGCGTRARASPWPEGWFETGRSARYGRVKGERRVVRRLAAWCGGRCYFGRAK